MKNKEMNKRKRKDYTTPSIKKFKITSLDKIDEVAGQCTVVPCNCGSACACACACAC